MGNSRYLAAILSAACAATQDAPPPPASFSIWQSPPTPAGQAQHRAQGGPGTSSPALYTSQYASIADLISYAYATPFYDLDGPDWFMATGRASDSLDKFDLSVTLPPNTTAKDLRALIQGMLTERFHLRLHHETREGPAYVLTLDGPLLIKESPALPLTVPPLQPPASPLSKGADGFDIHPAGFSGTILRTPKGAAIFKMQRRTIHDLANTLRTLLPLPVLDETGLSATYDYYLSFAAPDPLQRNRYNAPLLAPERVVDAVQAQTGLHLALGSGKYGLLVVDSVDRTLSK